MNKATSAALTVLKFGGTSVTNAENWPRIAQLIHQRRADGLQVLVVHSALRGVTDLLQGSLNAAVDGQIGGHVDDIRQLHEQLANALGIELPPSMTPVLAELEQLLAGIRLIREVTPKITARVLACGELLSSRLSEHWLQQHGLDVTWRDARELLVTVAERRELRHYLNASCDTDEDVQLRAQLADEPIVLTQGFIAADAAGDTVVLGRGGSDTSAAYFAAKMQAQQLEIWTDVPGLFSADPNVVSGARQLKNLHYSEAQEIASAGGQVLHPRSIGPAWRWSIPVHVRWTSRPDIRGTLISDTTGETEPQVKAVVMRQGVTLISIESVSMWQQSGFLARVFHVFGTQRVSVGLVSTSESSITVSLDDLDAPVDTTTIDGLREALSPLGHVQVLRDCAAVSIVGRKIRTILSGLGPLFEIFAEHKLHLLSQAANDLNLTVVVDTAQGFRLVQQLHPAVMANQPTNQTLGPSWEALQDTNTIDKAVVPEAWWRANAQALISAMRSHESLYLYDRITIEARIAGLQSLSQVDRVFYAMKANPHASILQLVHDAGLGFECVSPQEIDAVLSQFPDIERERILFTPNFCAQSDYQYGFEQAVRVTLDNVFPLQAWPETFANQSVMVRVDPGQGRGHHEHVRTAGIHSKFGVPQFELSRFAELTDAVSCSVVGIHAHTGSGVTQSDNWRLVGQALADAASYFPNARYLDLGGGLGVPEKPGDTVLDLRQLDQSLLSLKQQYPQYEIWLEPGRFVVAEAGVLLARVTQTKGKGDVRYVGVATGMNSLIRPALYGAFHEIVNLSRLSEPPAYPTNVVGPICETGDKLGTDRLLPACQAGDVILIANAGAYGAAMASHYNGRPPAREMLLER
ncbi:MAG: bifunctional aspartate kinase/diaminopimelate decarboxylase [Pseudomonadota bacterium]